MTKELAKSKTNSALAAAQSLRGNLATVQKSLPETRGAGFMSFGRDGVWSYGIANAEVTKNAEIALNPFSIETGFIAWTDREDKHGKNEVLGEQMYPLGQAVPTVHDMPERIDQKNDKRGAWKEQISVTMRMLDGEHKGTQVKFSTTSVGGIGAMKGLIDQIMLQLDEDPANVVPVVTLGSDNYLHKKWGKTYTPEINIQDWMSLEDQPDAEEDQTEEDQTEEDQTEEDQTEEDQTEEVEDAEVVAEEAAPPKRRRRQR